jgi:uncharacterized membrane protein
MSKLIVLTYDDQETGRQVFKELGNMQKMEILKLEDAALAFKDEKGKVKVKQTLENQVTGSAAIWGGFWGLLIGLLFLAPVVWGIVGALMAALFSRAGDVGIDNNFIKVVGESLDPGGSAVFMLVIEATPDKVMDDLKKFGGHVYQTSLTKEDEEKLKQVLEHGDVHASAKETLDLE